MPRLLSFFVFAILPYFILYINFYILYSPLKRKKKRKKKEKKEGSNKGSIHSSIWNNERSLRDKVYHHIHMLSIDIVFSMGKKS
jgi:hypothetical protein